MSNRYILQKDIPELKAGAVFEYDELQGGFICNYSNGNQTFYKKEYVENNPEWFLPEDKFGEWISGRLPRKDGYYLGFYKHNPNYVVLMFKYGSWFSGDNTVFKPIAWMPLPKPYEP